VGRGSTFEMIEIAVLSVLIVGAIALVGWWHGPEIPR
jgi:hypothetical protein